MYLSHLKYFYNAFDYDAMGNILTQKRHKRDGTKIEDLSYVYHTSGGKLVRNRLYHLDDVVGSGVDATDIDDMGTYDPDLQDINTLNNYVYDEEGRLVKDSAERISKIVWRVDGKVKEIQRATGDAKWLKFDYDAMGNRIAKHVYNNTGTAHERSTYYVLDAQGNQISTYDHEVVSENAQFNLKERNIFGSSRLGSKQDSLNVLTATLSQNINQILGLKYYEFSNHLGNVLTVYSDVKIPLDADANSVVDGFGVPIRNIADYSPFGVQLDGRTVSGDSYRFGFQNQEEDSETGLVNYKYRMHDPRIGRFFAVDPLAPRYPNNSPYAFSENVVINAIELEGLEKWEISNEKTYIETFFGPFNNEYINEQKSRVNEYEGIRQKTITVLEKVVSNEINLNVPFPLEPAPTLLKNLPIEISRSENYSYATAFDDKFVVYTGLDKKSEDFKIAVFSHEYVAHYLEGVLNLIEDSPGITTMTMEKNPFYDPSKPNKGINKEFQPVMGFSGSEDIAKEEINGWALMKGLHDNGLIKLSEVDYSKVLDNIKMYEEKLQRIQKGKADEK